METQAPEFHTRDEQKALLKATKNVRHRVLILIMLDVGCRVTEARTRKWEDCDFRARTVKVASLKHRFPVFQTSYPAKEFIAIRRTIFLECESLTVLRSL
jgi:integrase